MSFHSSRRCSAENPPPTRTSTFVLQSSSIKPPRVPLGFLPSLADDRLSLPVASLFASLVFSCSSYHPLMRPSASMNGLYFNMNCSLKVDLPSLYGPSTERVMMPSYPRSRH